MLYFLRSTSNETAFYLVQKKEFIIGRKDCDFVIKDDRSVSKKHAKISIKARKNKEVVILEDLKSKYKTFHNGTEVKPNTEIIVGIGDTIKIGGLSSVFKLESQQIVTTATRLSSSKKDALNQNLSILGARYVNDWCEECTHLTLEKRTLTHKVLMALIDVKHMVTFDYWAKFAENVNRNLSPPNINEYNDPPVSDAVLTIEDFKLKKDRKKLFKSLIFVFFSEKEKMQVYKIIEYTGGTAISWEKAPLSLEEIKSTDKNIILIQPSENVNDKTYTDLTNYYSNQNKRTIPLAEIALAIVRASVEKDCNPNFNRAKQVFQRSTTSSQKYMSLEDGTESYAWNEIQINRELKLNSIPETIDLVSDNLSLKRKAVESDVQEEVRGASADSDAGSLKRLKLEDQSLTRKLIKGGQENQSSEPQIINDDKRDEVNNIQVISSDSDDENVPIHNKKRKANEQLDEKNNIKIDVKKTRTEPLFEETNTESLNFFNSDSTGDIKDVPVDNPFLDDNEFFAPTSPNNIEIKEVKNFLEIEEHSLEPYLNTIKMEESNSKPRINNTIESTVISNWIAKGSCIKKEIKEEEDENLRNFMNLFRDKLIVEIVADISFRLKEKSHNESTEKTCNGVNFKKFKKVKPAFPQTTILSNKSFKSWGPHGVIDIHDSRMPNYDSDEDRPTQRKRGFIFTNQKR